MKEHAKKLHKLVALALALVLITGLAACSGGGSTDTGTTATNPPAAASTADTPAASSASEPVAPADEPDLGVMYVKDMEGRNFNFFCWWDYLYWLGQPEPNPEESTNYVVDMMHYDAFNKMLEDYNCTVSNTTVTWEEVPDILTTSVMAGDPCGDMVTMDGAWVLNAIIGNLLIPYEDFLPADHDLFTTRQRSKPSSEMAGKTWTVAPQGVNTEGTFLGVNLEIIRSIGAENPADLYDQGEWTFDKFLEIARMATKDTDGDGVIDQYGLSGQANDFLIGFMAANGASMVTEDFKYGFDSPKAMTALEAMYQIFAIDKSWNFDPNSGAEFWDWGRNMAACLEGRTAMFIEFVWQLPDAENRTFEYTAVPFPKGPEYDGYTFMTGFTQGQAIPRGVKNPEDVFLIWEQYNNSWYGDDYDLMLEEGLTWPYSKFMTEKDAERIVLDVLANQGKIDLGFAVTVDGIGYTWVTGDYCLAFFEGTATPAQIVEEKRQIHQDMLDTVFGAFTN